MPTTVYLIDNRPEAVSSAHWGDEWKFAFRVPGAVFSAHREDISTLSPVSFLKALLKLLAADPPTQAVQQKDTQSPPGSLSLASACAGRTRSQWNEPARAETGM